MGCIYATLMAEAGHEVWTIDTWQEHVDAIREKGLRLEGASGDRTVAVNATTDAGEAGICDLVIIATKAMHVEQAAKSANALVGEETDILTIQNGLGSADRWRPWSMAVGSPSVSPKGSAPPSRGLDTPIITA